MEVEFLYVKDTESVTVDQRYMDDVLPLNVAMRINKNIHSI